MRHLLLPRPCYPSACVTDWSGGGWRPCDPALHNGKEEETPEKRAYKDILTGGNTGYYIATSRLT
ncbi:rCG32363 [Rattus norvegicus]|uniref:RCG32363 n=1 Tax=Rattus norvegicus TaxID=10116 RepID=A6JXR2_RAT|nr:rCG32363 [Rattus norvegicus]